MDEEGRDGSSKAFEGQEVKDEILLNILNEAKELLISKCSENYQHILNFIQLSFEIFDYYNYLPNKIKRSFENDIFAIKSLSEDNSKNQKKTISKVSKFKTNFQKYMSIGIDAKQSLTSSKYCFYYTKSRSSKESFSKIVSLNIINKSIEELCKGNRFKNSSLSCRINENLIFIYFSTKKNSDKGPLLLNLSEQVGSDCMKTFVQCSNHKHYHSAFVLMENNELGFFGAQNRICESFNYISKTWKPLKSLPFDISSPTAAFYNGVVFMVGISNSTILKYSQESNNYEIIQSLVLEEQIKKLLFCVNSCLYLLQGKKLYLYEKQDFVFIRELKKVQNYEKVISFPIFKDPFVYFLTNYRKVFSFKLRD